LKQQYKTLVTNSYVENFLDKVEDLYASFKTYDTEIILNNQIVARAMHNSIIYDVGYNNLKNADLMIYNQNVKHKKTNKVIFYGISDFTIFIDKIENCSYEFLSLNINILYPGMESKNVDIVFSNNKETLYVVSNRINVLMISYLLKVQHNIITDPLLLAYEIQVIDQNASFFTITEKDELILYKDHYEIVPFDLNKIKERRNNKNKENNKNMTFTSFDNIENENSMPRLTIDINKIMEYCNSIYVAQNIILKNENGSDISEANESEANGSEANGSESNESEENGSENGSDNSYEKLE
jgi:hypothetical protein